MPDDDSALGRVLRHKLAAEELKLLRRQRRKVSEADYVAMFDRVIERVARFRREYERDVARLSARLPEILSNPGGRRRTFLRNSSQSTLLALIQVCLRRSSEVRVEDPRRALELAERASEVADLVEAGGFVPREVIADRRVEVYALLGDLRREALDYAGAEEAFAEADRHVRRGTGDPRLEAGLLGLRAGLRQDERRLDEAAELFDLEIAVRRGLFDRDKLGTALINRGMIAAWTEPLWKACEYFEEGAALVADPLRMVSTLHPAAEGLARKGCGGEAWKVLCAAGSVLTLIPSDDQVRRRHRWIKGVTLGALGRLPEAVAELVEVRRSFAAGGLPMQAALVAVDLAAVYARLGQRDEIRRLAREAETTFARREVEMEARKAFRAFYRAAQEGTATADLATEVANFLVRFQWDRRLRFGGEGR